MSADAYDAYIAEWKAKHGVPAECTDSAEMRMLAQDAKDTSKDYCLGCGEQFRVCDMRLVLPAVDPYVQYDPEETPKDPDYIPKCHRVRMCAPCYKRDYESFDEPEDDTPKT